MTLGKVEVPEPKIMNLCKMLMQANPSRCIKARFLANLLGKIMSMGLAFGTVSRFMTRTCTQYCNLDTHGVTTCCSLPRPRQRGYVVEHGACVSHGQWTQEEAGKSSTWRELSAVWIVLLSVAPKLLNARVQ